MIYTWDKKSPEVEFRALVKINVVAAGSYNFYSTTTSGFAIPITPHAKRDPAAPVG